VARYRPEPAFDSARRARDAVLLVNLGTPDAPTARAVRRYLGEFLADPRVVEIPRALWLPLLHGVILPVRAAQSAEKYASIWLAEGSPLAVHTERQARLLRDWLDTRLGHDAPLVDYAMRYGRPSLPERLDRLRAAGCERILLLPLYPQYAASTTASVVDALGAWLARTRNQPEVRCIKHYHEHPAYIAALAAQVRRHWEAHGRAAPLVMSFHGLPKFSIERGDPYYRECQRSAQLLAGALNLSEREWRLTFQSRFGRTEWLQPYTQPTLVELARGGQRRVDVVCPGFVADCLETLEELGIVARRAFLEAGGGEFNLLACLNEAPEWIDALGALVRENLWSARG
jgi:ferrochelatase